MRARWNNEDFRRDVDTIKNDVAQLKNDLVSAMRDLIAASREGVDDATGRLQQQVQSKLEALNEATEELSMYGRRAARQVRQSVEEHPARTAMIVLAAGALLGMLLMNRRR